MKKKGPDRPWTDDEIQFLRDNAHLSVASLAGHLGRTEDSVSRAKVTYNVNRLQFVELPGRKWKAIAEFPGYEVSDHGEVRNTKRGNVLKYRVDKNGYCVISFKQGKKTLNRTIHRFVASSFVRNPKALPEVNHKDGDKTNNFWKNLEWVTESQNMQHAHDTGLICMPTGDNHWTRRKGVKYFVGSGIND